MVLILSSGLGLVDAIYHLKRGSYHRHTSRNKPVTKHHKKDKAVTRIEQVKAYPKFLHLEPDYESEGKVVTEGFPQKFYSFVIAKSAFDERPSGLKRSRNQRPVSVEVLSVPVEDPRSLKKMAALPQSDTITIMAEDGELISGPTAEFDVEETNENGRGKENKMKKKVGIFIRYLNA